MPRSAPVRPPPRGVEEEHAVSKKFILRGFPKDPVQAGTTVRLEALLEGSLPDPKLWRIDWRIVGPRSDDEQVLPDRGPKLDFTPGIPGAYAAYARRATRPD